MITDQKPSVEKTDIVADFTTSLRENSDDLLGRYADFGSIGNVPPIAVSSEPHENNAEAGRQAGPILHNSDPNDVPIGVGGDADDNVLFIRGGEGPYVVDGGDGEDTLDLSVFQVGVRLSFFDGMFQDIGAPKDFTSSITAVENVIGTGHDDILLGDTLRNEFFGGDGDDQLLGYAGSDLLLGQGGDDFLKGGRGKDTLVGGDGEDALNGGTEDDLLRGSDGNDYLWGVTGNDTLEGGAGDDKLRGGSDNDIMSGGDGTDDIRGQTGDDVMSGDAGNDWMSGGAGDDILSGGTGQDAMIGGAGADVFVFAPGDEIDKIKDWEGGIDRIDLSAWDFEDVDAVMSRVSKTNEYTELRLSDVDFLYVYSPEKLDLDDVIL